MELQNFTAKITRIDDATDKDGTFFYKCKGYEPYPLKPNFKRKNGRSFFIFKFYGTTEQLADLKERLFKDDSKYPYVECLIKKSKLFNYCLNGRSYTTIFVYDWKTMNKTKPKKKIESEEIEQGV